MEWRSSLEAAVFLCIMSLACVGVGDRQTFFAGIENVVL